MVLKDMLAMRSRERIRRLGKGNILLGEVELDGKVVEDTGSELGLEELGDGAGVDVAEELKGVGVGGVLAEDGTGLEDDLVGAEVGALEEDELVLVGQVQGRWASFCREK